MATLFYVKMATWHRCSPLGIVYQHFYYIVKVMDDKHTVTQPKISWSNIGICCINDRNHRFFLCAMWLLARTSHERIIVGPKEDLSTCLFGWFRLVSIEKPVRILAWSLKGVFSNLDYLAAKIAQPLLAGSVYLTWPVEDWCGVFPEVLWPDTYGALHSFTS